MASQITLDTSLAPTQWIHRFTVAEYHRLGEVGLLSPEDQVELLEGWIVQKRNQRPIHGFVVRLLNRWFMQHLPEG